MKKLDYGFSFMEKFVQLSFSVPKSSQNTLANFLNSLNEKDNREQKPKWTPFTLSIIKLINYVKFYVKFKLEQFKLNNNNKEAKKTENQNI